MLSKKLAVTIAMGVAVALPGAVWGAQAKETGAKKPAAEPVAKATQEVNLKKFKALPDSAVVAIVGTEKITKGELVNALWDWMTPSTLDEFINTKIVAQAAKKDGIKITQADINKKIAETQLPPGQSIDETLQRMKQTLARFTSVMTLQVGLEKIIEKQTKITDAEYAQFVHGRQIVIRPQPGANEDATKKNKAEAKEKADKAAAEIKGGKSFEAVVKEYSDDPSKDTGGDIGWFRKGEKFPQTEVSDAVFKLKPGEVTEPLDTWYGYFIVKVDRLGKDASAAEKAEMKRTLIKQAVQMKMGQVFQELKDKTKVTNFISPPLPEPKTQPGFMPGGPPPRTGPGPRTSPIKGPENLKPRVPPQTPPGAAGDAAKPAPPPPAPPKDVPAPE